MRRMIASVLSVCMLVNMLAPVAYAEELNVGEALPAAEVTEAEPEPELPEIVQPAPEDEQPGQDNSAQTEETPAEDAPEEVPPVAEEPAEVLPEPTPEVLPTAEPEQGSSAPEGEQPAQQEEQVETAELPRYNANVLKSGSCGPSAQYALYDDGLLEITGTGRMNQPSTASAVSWYSYKTKVKEVRIAEGITSIGDYAFNGCTNLSKITVPESVTTISAIAFQDCNKLTTAGPIGSGCDYEFGWTTTIPANAFYNLMGVYDVTIPDGVTKIGNYAFSGCTGITDVNLPDSVTSIDQSAFLGCISITNMKLPLDLVTIGASAFSGCTSLGNVTIPNGVTTINTNAFKNCTSLVAATLPDSITSMGKDVFSGCTNLADVYYSGSLSQWQSVGNLGIPNTTLHIEGTAYQGGGCGDTNWVLHENGTLVIGGVGRMDNYSTSSPAPWDGMKDKIKAVVVNEGVTRVGEYAFKGCTNLTSVSLPDSLTLIGVYAFYGCERLTDIVLPENVDMVRSYTFYGCTRLARITLPESITKINERAFYGCTSLTDITVPNGVTVLGNYAFEGCTGIKHVVIPVTVTSIGSYAFSNCTRLADVFYSGTQPQWEQLTIPTGNDSLKNSNMHYSYHGGNKGSCGDNVKWTLGEDGTLTISGSGAMNSYSSTSYVPWYLIHDSIKSVVVEEGVTSISNYAFDGCKNLKTISLPASVTSIGSYAFYGCSGLTSITLPEGVTSIGSSAFYYCSGLTSITIPEGLTSIGDSAFYGCSSLTGLTIPESVTSIGSNAFYNCSKLTTAGPVGSGCGIEFGWKTTIPANAFRGCSGLTSITIPEGLTSIGDSAFYGCSRLTGITIPESVTSIGSSAFYGCSKLTTAGSIGSGCDYEFGWKTTIPANAFRGCSGLTSITIPEGVTSIGSSAFSGCSSLTSITIPESVTNIGSSAFYGCSGLTSITLPEGVTSIGERAFYNCSSLTSTTIPESVTNIGKYAFYGCSSLTQVFYNGSNEEWAAVQKTNSGLEGKTITYSSITGTCGNDVRWQLVGDTLTISGNGKIDDNNYSNNLSPAPWENWKTLIKSVVIENGVTGIGNAAFYKHSNLTSITLPESITRIGNHAFSGCSSLTNVTIPAGVTSMGECVFLDCSKLTTAGPIGSGCDIVLKWRTEIPAHAFRNCNNLTSITIPEGVASIGWYAFYNCSNLTSITIPESVTSIDLEAFYNCSSLTSITIPESVTSIGNDAFSGCSSLTNITISKNVTSINSSAFEGCSSLTTITIPEGVTNIDSYAFRNCSRLTNITIPESVTSIGEEVFSGCDKLTRLLYNGSSTKWETVQKYNSGLEDKTIIFGKITGTCGDGVNWQLMGSTLTISGNGNLDVTEYANAPWEKQKSQIKSVVIEDGVTGIGERAFYNCSSLTSITIPESVTSIGYNAFDGCSRLTSITLPESVTSIGGDVFSNCSRLTTAGPIGSGCNIEFGWKTTIPMDAFLGCSSLTSITIPEGVTTIDGYAFSSCRNLTSITIPESMTSIDECAFDGCSSLTSITLPEGMTSIGHDAFSNCSRLTSITIPEGVTSIGFYAFSGCSRLTTAGPIGSGCNIEFGWKTTIPANAFSGCFNLTNITLPEGVTSIGDNAFRNCSSLTSITIPEGVTSIGNNAFKDCGSLTSITIPESVTSIGNYAFSGCSSLTQVFYNGGNEEWEAVNKTNSGLEGKTITYSRITGSCGNNVRWQLVGDTLTISGNGDMDDTENGNAPWNNWKTLIKSVVIEDGVTSIGDYAFQNCSNLTNITIPDSVTSIGSNAFRDCSGLTSITIPESVTSIGSSAFYGCSGLTSITIPEGVTSIGNYAFSGCSSLTQVFYNGGNEEWEAVNKTNSGLEGKTITYSRITGSCGNNVRWQLVGDTLTISGNGDMDDTENGNAPWNNWKTLIKSVVIEDGVTSIGSYAFSYCSNLTSITIPESVTGIGSYAFKACSSLTSITIPEGVTSIGEGAFQNCNNLTSITIPESVTGIGSNAFSGCSSLTTAGPIGSGCNYQYSKNLDIPSEIKRQMTKVIIPEGVTSIGERAFYNCSSLTSITIPEGVTSIGSYAFSYCSNLTSITIPDSVTSIGESAFSGCSGLTSITIPEGVTSIDYNAFRNCSSLTSITIPEGVTSIGSNAFRDCSGLTSITIPESVTSIGSSAFSGCSGLTTAGPVGSGCDYEFGWKKTIPANAFSGCSSLTSITIPEGVTSIGYDAFSGCSSLTSITIPEGVTSIGYYAFSGCSSLTSITIPESVTSIGFYAFSGCSSLTSITIPESVTSIGFYAFSGCSSLTSITIPESVTSIGFYAFSGCSRLTTAGPIGSGCDYEFGWKTKIPAYAFDGCSSLTSITIPESVTSIGYYAFRDCGSLTSITIPEGVTSIGGSAFYGCSGLTTAGPVGSGCDYEFGWKKTIPANAFSGCSSLTSITIPEGVTSIGGSAFERCSSLTSITIPEGVTSIGYYAFSGCSSLTSITIPEGVTSIGSSAFYGCTFLQKVSIPSTVTSIDSTAFSGAPVTIYGFSGTAAETFAKNNNIPFVKYQVHAETVALGKDEIMLAQGETYDLTVTVEPTNFTDDVVWSSLNTVIATVDQSGQVKAINPGVTTVVVTVGSVEATCRVMVKQPVTSIRLNKTALNMDALEAFELEATVNPSDAYNKAVTWESSNPEVASVDENGVVNARTKGIATITARAQDGSDIFATCMVTVQNNGVLATDVDQLESKHDYDNNSKDIWRYSIPGAEKLELTFDSRTSLENGYDYLYILDGDTNQIGRYTGTALAGKRIVIEGDTFYLRLTSDASVSGWGFKVTSVRALVVAKVIFDANGGELDAPEKECFVGDTLGQMPKPEIVGGAFHGWFTRPEGGEEITGDYVLENAGPLTLYAHWKWTDYYLYFNANGGTCTTSSYKVNYNGTPYGELPTPVFPGYDFCGWFTAQKGGTEVTEESVLPSPQNQTIYARWSPKTLHIHLDMNGGSGCEELDHTVVYKETYPELPSPERTGYTFTGWYAPEETEPVSRCENTEDHTLTAGWEANKYQLSFETYGGDPVEAITVTYDSTYGELPVPIMVGCEFVEWTLEDGTTVSGETTVKATEDHTLYAVWDYKYIAEMPTADIEPGTEVEPGTRLSLSTATNGAEIYYTLDGTVPTAESILYTDAIVLTNELTDEDGLVTIRAIAMKDGYLPSEVAAFTYTVIDYSDDWGDVTEEDQLALGGDITEIPEQLWVAGVEDADYTGAAITYPGLRVYWYKQLLTLNKDYTVKYTNNVKAGTARVTITGKGNYAGTINRDFTIRPLNIADAQLAKDFVRFKYNGKVQKATNTLTYDLNGKTVTLKANTDFTYVYPGTTAKQPDYDANAFKAAGTYTVNIVGKGNYTGEISFTQEITSCTLMGTLAYSIGNNVFDRGTPVEPKTLTVKHGSKLLTGYLVADADAAGAALTDPAVQEDYDYVYYCTDNVEVGKAGITFVGVPERGYIDTVTKNYNVTGWQLGKMAFKNFPASKPWNNGDAINPFKFDVNPAYLLNGKVELVGIEAEEYETLDDVKKRDFDYTYSIENNVNIGKATITMNGVNGYSGKVVKTFNITGYQLGKMAFKDFAASYAWTGFEIDPFTQFDKYAHIMNGPMLLFGATEEGYAQMDPATRRIYDYTYSITNNVEVGKATITLNGVNGYSGKVTKTFNVTGTAIGAIRVESLLASYGYSGEAIEPVPTKVYFAATKTAPEKVLTAGDDYTVTYLNNVKVGTGTVVITGINAYTGVVKKTFKITAHTMADIADSRIWVNEIGTLPYVKGGVKPAVTVYDGATELTLNKDYTVKYANNAAANGAKAPTVTITGKGNYTGSRVVNFTIEKQNLANMTMTATDVIYQNKANICKPTITLTDLNNTKLAAKTDYNATIAYTYAKDVRVTQLVNKQYVPIVRSEGSPVDAKDIIPVGAEIRATAKGVNNYEGEQSVVFRFAAGNIASAAVTVLAQPYTGKAIQPDKNAITVKMGKTVLNNCDYEIVGYANNVNKGTGKVTIRGIGNYTGTKTVNFSIVNKSMNYTVVYDSNNEYMAYEKPYAAAATGTMKNGSVASGTKLAGNAYKRNGYTFAGWNTKPDGSGAAYTNAEVFKLKENRFLTAIYGHNVTLYAQWTSVTYKISYANMAGAVGNTNVTTYTVEDEVEFTGAHDIVKLGYTLVGWYSDSALKKPIEGLPQGTVGNKTIYPKWQKNLG